MLPKTAGNISGILKLVYFPLKKFVFLILHNLIWKILIKNLFNLPIYLVLNQNLEDSIDEIRKYIGLCT